MRIRDIKAHCNEQITDMMINNGDEVVDGPIVGKEVAARRKVAQRMFFVRPKPEKHEINEKMRDILVEWLIEVYNKFELMHETLYLTVHMVDWYLSMRSVSRKILQLIGMSSMLIASKYEEIWAPEVNDFVCIAAKHRYL
ncbi:hypothetical protein IFM89_027557 [Coptis chinensis]|uniref:Cyclin-like domain-containing protein n=1 Tax=Coptis chinensis TaxID=261450 RepID=A0A835HSJ4_9MAGN|nr:hypothetical protein IFM89_027557 [Coptis chinensis]